MKAYFLAGLVSLVLPFVLLHPISNNNEAGALQLPQEEGTGALSPIKLAASSEGLIRDKRTIGPLRQIFPNLSQLVDSKIQMITRVLFRVVGRLVLRGGLGGGMGGSQSNSSAAGGSGGGRRISITLPTYPPGEDDDEDEDEDDTQASDTETTTEGDSKNQLDGAASENHEVRVPYSAPAIEEVGDLDTAASEDNEESVDAVDTADAATQDEDPIDESRGKRFLNFNLGGSTNADSTSAGGGGGGSGGGSGNFLFDIIRLVAGSGNTEAGDERANAAVGVAVEQSVEKDDGYQAGIPGPITRLFIIANRGIANLMQDLILRLAQTSERIVNFKARLITSII